MAHQENQGLHPQADHRLVLRNNTWRFKMKEGWWSLCLKCCERLNITRKGVTLLWLDIVLQDLIFWQQNNCQVVFSWYFAIIALVSFSHMNSRASPGTRYRPTQLCEVFLLCSGAGFLLLVQKLEKSWNCTKSPLHCKLWRTVVFVVLHQHTLCPPAVRRLVSSSVFHLPLWQCVSLLLPY